MAAAQRIERVVSSSRGEGSASRTMDHSWLRFSTDVTINGDRPVEDCVRLLQTLTAPPDSYSRPDRLRPFRGRIDFNKGLLRYPLLTYGMMRGRFLRFDLHPCGTGTVLSGKWQLLKRIRIPVAIYLVICIIAQAVELIRLTILQRQDSLLMLVGPAISLVMIYGWTWTMVALNRRSEARLIRAIAHAMESDRSARIVNELLSVPE